jgi:hypothetical protein
MNLLDAHFAGVDGLLRRKLRAIRSATRHKGGRGDDLAKVLGENVQKHLVDCSSFHERCEVRDSRDRVSNQVDLVFLNRFHPTFSLQEPPRLFLIEGVMAAAEVKTVLNKPRTIECLESARSFKRLQAKVDGRDLGEHNIEVDDWPRFLFSRPFFAFAYEDTRSLNAIAQNIQDWTTENHVPAEQQIDALFVLNRGIILNLGPNLSVFKDDSGDPMTGLVSKETAVIFSQLMLWLATIGPVFRTLHPILLRHGDFSTDGYE